MSWLSNGRPDVISKLCGTFLHLQFFLNVDSPRKLSQSELLNYNFTFHYFTNINSLWLRICIPRKSNKSGVFFTTNMALWLQHDRIEDAPTTHPLEIFRLVTQRDERSSNGSSTHHSEKVRCSSVGIIVKTEHVEHVDHVQIILITISKSCWSWPVPHLNLKVGFWFNCTSFSPKSMVRRCFLDGNDGLIVISKISYTITYSMHLGHLNDLHCIKSTISYPQCKRLYSGWFDYS